MVLCAGLGTRLRPLTEWLAKPMVPIGDKPALGHIAARLRRERRDARIVVNVHHRPDDVRAWAQANDALVSEEREDLLGTAGGVAHARHLLGDADDVLIWNGDILAGDLDVEGLSRAHARGAVDATLAVLPRTSAGEGNVGLDDQGHVVRLRKESFGREARGADFIGVHVLGRRLRSALPAKGCLVGDVYIPALGAGAKIGAFVLPEAFSFEDIGDVNAYVRANQRWLRDAGRVDGTTSWIDEAATVASRVKIEGSIVGAHARIEADVVRSIVWPHSVVTEPVSDAIVTPHGIVRVTL